jgi:hypothetical protein
LLNKLQWRLPSPITNAQFFNFNFKSLTYWLHGLIGRTHEFQTHLTFETIDKYFFNDRLLPSKIKFVFQQTNCCIVGFSSLAPFTIWCSNNLNEDHIIVATTKNKKKKVIWIWCSTQVTKHVGYKIHLGWKCCG